MSQAVVGDLAKLQTVPRDLARWQKAQNQLMSGRYGHALAAYQSLITAYPEAAQLWFEMGIAAGGILDFPLARKAFQASAGLAGNDASLLVLIGQQYQRLRQLSHARQCYERAVEVVPESIHARLSLSAWFERERRLDEAEFQVEKSLAMDPKDPAVIYFKAFLLHRRGKDEIALQILRDLTGSGLRNPGVLISAQYLLATILDKFGQYPEAIQALHKAKAAQRDQSEVALLERIYDRTAQQRRTLMLSLKASTIQRWQSENVKEPSAHKLVFLGGHPRSGTTLVAQLLGAHPEVLAIDESEAFTQEVLNEVVPAHSVRGLSLDSMNALSSARRAFLRERYFRSLLREINGDVGKRILLDKNPSPTSSMPLWLRVFPGLKVIMPLRDPRDVVISCFFQNLAMTAANVNFLSLERTTRHFTEMMDVWFRMKELGHFEWIETQYEQVVDDVETEGRRLASFAGLQWHAAQSKHHEAARQKFVFAPTYHDVTKPVHRGAIDRWKNYRETLAPVLEKLEPYGRAMGYF